MVTGAKDIINSFGKDMIAELGGITETLAAAFDSGKDEERKNQLKKDVIDALVAGDNTKFQEAYKAWTTFGNQLRDKQQKDKVDVNMAIDIAGESAENKLVIKNINFNIPGAPIDQLNLRNVKLDVSCSLDASDSKKSRWENIDIGCTANGFRFHDGVAIGIKFTETSTNKNVKFDNCYIQGLEAKIDIEKGEKVALWINKYVNNLKLDVIDPKNTMISITSGNITINSNTSIDNFVINRNSELFADNKKHEIPLIPAEAKKIEAMNRMLEKDVYLNNTKTVIPPAQEKIDAYVVYAKMEKSNGIVQTSGEIGNKGIHCDPDQKARKDASRTY